MLTLRLDEIPDEGLDLSWEEEKESLADYLGTPSQVDFSFDSSLHSEAKVRRSGKTVFITGSIKTDLRLRCVRCLEEFAYPFASDFDLALLPLEAGSAEEEERELAKEEMGLSYHQGEEINLSQVVFEQVFLELPYQPLCRAGCKGLCQKCGTDLNFSTCACAQEGFEKGFSVLRKLKVDR